jgi:hypothetical protein
MGIVFILIIHRGICEFREVQIVYSLSYAFLSHLSFPILAKSS